jgi:cytochrome c peroxidase
MICSTRILIGLILSYPVASYGQQDLHRAGDFKEGYDQSYQTNSLSLDYRALNKKKFNLIEGSSDQLGLPSLPIPEGNPLTLNKVDLGKKLFFDRRLSLNNTFSCAMCHIPEQGFSSNELRTSVGIEGRTVRRNAPTIYNVAHMKNLFHDAREDSLEWQVWSPLLAKNEMGNPSFASVVNKIKSIKSYDSLFEDAFGGQGVSVVTIGKALASYQRVLVSADSDFDRWHYANHKGSMNKEEKLGFKLFIGKAKCVNCHSIGNQYALFTDNKLHNTGIGYLSSMSPGRGDISVQVSPGIYIQASRRVINTVSEKVESDLGLYEITENPDHRWQYRTPSLRNIALTSPYMHNGSISSLTEVVQFYNRGGISNPLISPLIQPLNLNTTEVELLVNFLNSLTGNNVNNLVEDAFNAPVGEVIH